MKDPSANRARVLQQGANNGGGKIGLFDSGFGSVSLARTAASHDQLVKKIALENAGRAFGLALKS